MGRWAKLVPGAESWSSLGTSETIKGLEGRERGFRETDHMLVSVKNGFKRKMEFR